jgi:hypothetical protein
MGLAYFVSHPGSHVIVEGTRKDFDDLMEEFEMNSHKPTLDGEWGRFVYTSWILHGYEHGALHAQRIGERDLAERIIGKIRKVLAFMCAGSSGIQENRHAPGVHPTICGGRSALNGKPRNDISRPIDQLDWNYLSLRLGNYLQVPISTRVPYVRDSERDIRGFFGTSTRDFISANERRNLLKVATGDMDGFDTVKAMMSEGQLPLESVRVRRTTKGVLSMIEDGIKPGSTPCMYAHAWWFNGAPRWKYWDGFGWKPRNVLALAVDNWTVRSQGRDGIAELDIDAGVIRAQRKSSHDYFDERDQQFPAGWKEMPIPDGDVLLDLRIDKRHGVQDLANVEEPVDPPPPNTWSARRHVKVARRQCDRALDQRPPVKEDVTKARNNLNKALEKLS